MFRGKKRAGEIDVQDKLPVLELRFMNPANTRCSRIRHHSIQAAELFRHLLDRCFHLGLVRHVAGHGNRYTATLGDLISNLPGQSQAPVENANECALIRKALTGSFADAAAASGDDDGSSFKPSCFCHRYTSHSNIRQSLVAMNTSDSPADERKQVLQHFVLFLAHHEVTCVFKHHEFRIQSLL